ncbi:putative gluconeogenesis factor [Rhypophila decipiens]
MENGANGVGTGRRAEITVFSGGTAANSLVDVFNNVTRTRRCRLNYVIPISDNGGSSSELIRVLGGPSVGDIRSRLVRLIPENNAEMTALKALFEHRLVQDTDAARTEWLEIVEGRYLGWTYISSPKMELIRSVLNTVNLEIVKRNRESSRYNFSNASVGNMFLAGARIFSGSFESAIYLLSIICSIPPDINVLPAINSNFTHHISAVLDDGTSIAGQVAISHPSSPTALPDDAAPVTDAPSTTISAGDGATSSSSNFLSVEEAEDANLPGSLSVLRRPNIAFSKDEEEDLPARIKQIQYINPYGHEIRPAANTKVVEAIKSSTAVIYSIGSLYTSIIPSLILRGVGKAIEDTPMLRHKILILNSKLDRETGGKRDPMSAKDFVEAIASAVASTTGQEINKHNMRKYVSYLVYLEGEGTPFVDVAMLQGLGIACINVQGRLVQEKHKTELRYDEEALGRVLEGILSSQDLLM